MKNWVKVMRCCQIRHNFKCTGYLCKLHKEYLTSLLLDQCRCSAGGGLLSPALFAMYMGVLIALLKNSGVGCSLHGFYIGCLCYADDIVLISHSIYAMQCVLNICKFLLACLMLNVIILNR